MGSRPRPVLMAGRNPDRRALTEAILAVDPDARCVTQIANIEIWASTVLGAHDVSFVYEATDGAVFVRRPHVEAPS